MAETSPWTEPPPDDYNWARSQGAAGYAEPEETPDDLARACQAHYDWDLYDRMGGESFLGSVYSSSYVEDLEAFVESYVSFLEFNAVYDRWVLDCVCAAVGDRGEELVYETLLKGLRLTGDYSGAFLPRASFMNALAKLGDKRACEDLRAILVSSHFVLSRTAAGIVLTNLGDSEFVKHREDLETRARAMIDMQMRVHDVLWERKLKDDHVLRAMELLDSEGSFVAKVVWKNGPFGNDFEVSIMSGRTTDQDG